MWSVSKSFQRKPNQQDILMQVLQDIAVEGGPKGVCPCLSLLSFIFNMKRRLDEN